ncbi:MAG: hypothetical protein QW756_01925 [Nitrososphaerota archaeon]
MRRKHTFRGVVTASAALLAYLLVVILTTPNLHPVTAATTAIRVNAWFLIGLTASLGFQDYLTAKASQSRCSIKRSSLGLMSIGGSALSSFVSFLPLTQLGCCGFWLYVLSLIAGSGGAGLGFTALVLDMPPTFMWASIGMIWAGNIYILWRLRGSVKTPSKLLGTYPT